MIRARAIAAFALAVALSPPAMAQPVMVRPQPRPVLHPPPLAATSDDPGDLRARFGVERAAGLVRSGDADERLRGLERAAALGTADAVALLIQQLDSSAATRGDARAKIVIARALALHVQQQQARSALLLILGLGAPRQSAQRSEADEPLYLPRLEVARRVAALALAQSGDVHALESLVAIARGTTIGAAAAMAALAAFPPSSSATWAKPMSPGVVKLLVRTGDLRALDDVLGAARAGNDADARTREAAIEGLGALGDSRVLPIAAGALEDEDPGVRTAAASALVALGAPEASRAVEKLLADDVTAGHGIELAMVTHGPGIVHALAARAAVSADLSVRSAAVAALGRDPTAEGIEALSALVGDPLLRADAADAMARSPSPAAMAAIERLAASPASKRLAARAYVVRAVARTETSAALERCVAELARSSEGRDRAVGVFAQVVLGETSAVVWLADPDPLVRRAAAMASLRGNDRSASIPALLARRAAEGDAPTRAVFALALVDGDASGQVPTRALVSCARAGGADAPLCALAVARRASQDDASVVAELLSSRDPLIRAHAARGLGLSDDPTRAGRLAAAYPYEPDPLVRRALVTALSRVPGGNPNVADTLALAARLDPDPEIRWEAAHGAPPAGNDGETDIAWIHLVGAAGSPPLAGATASLLRGDGDAVPIAFDADGDALVPGLPRLPATSSRLVLAPRLDAAYAPSP